MAMVRKAMLVQGAGAGAVVGARPVEVEVGVVGGDEDVEERVVKLRDESIFMISTSIAENILDVQLMTKPLDRSGVSNYP